MSSGHGDRLRLLYLINGLGTGGAERSLAELLPYFLTHGIEPTVVCLYRRQQGVEERIRALGCGVRYLPGGRLPLANVRALRRLLRTERPDLIQTTLFDSHMVGRFAAVGTGIPLLSSLVNTSYEPVRLLDPNVNRLGLWVAKMRDRWTAPLTSHFHAVSHAVKDSAARALRVDPQRITVVERGRDPQRLGTPSPERRRAARLRLGLAEEDEVIVNVGRQEYLKGQRYLIAAMSRLVETRPRLVLLIAGRAGHATAEIESLHAQLGLGDRVRFLGHRDDVPEILAAADLFVFPSIFEGIGGALIEAIALGLPVVASNIPAIREVVQEGRTARLVAPADPAPLAAAIAHLLDSPEEAREFGRRGREVFEERFTLERSATRMLDLYREVVSAGRGRSAQGTAPRARTAGVAG